MSSKFKPSKKQTNQTKSKATKSKRNQDLGNSRRNDYH